MPDRTIRPDLLARLHEIMNDIANASYEAGREDMRAAILSAAQAPVVQQRSAPARPSTVRTAVTRPSADRAPRGSVRAAIRHVLTQQPGLTEMELGAKVSAYDPNVSARSMGGELRRRRGSLYRSDGGKWYLIARESGKEAAGSRSDPADLLDQAITGVPYAEAPIAA